MRKWYAAAAVGALFALPLIAQQKDESAAKPETESAAVPATATLDAPAAPASLAPSTRGVFALPAVPKATPFPGPQSAKKDKGTDAPGRLVPKYEVNVGYSYIDLRPGDPFSNFNNHGVTGGFTYNANSVLGLTADYYLSLMETKLAAQQQTA